MPKRSNNTSFISLKEKQKIDRLIKRRISNPVLYCPKCHSIVYNANEMQMKVLLENHYIMNLRKFNKTRPKGYSIFNHIFFELCKNEKTLYSNLIRAGKLEVSKKRMNRPIFEFQSFGEINIGRCKGLEKAGKRVQEGRNKFYKRLKNVVVKKEFDASDCIVDDSDGEESRVEEKLEVAKAKKLKKSGKDKGSFSKIKKIVRLIKRESDLNREKIGGLKKENEDLRAVVVALQRKIFASEMRRDKDAAEVRDMAKKNGFRIDLVNFALKISLGENYEEKESQKQDDGKRLFYDEFGAFGHLLKDGKDEVDQFIGSVDSDLDGENEVKDE